MCKEVRTFLRNVALFLTFVSPLSNELLEWESQGFLVPSCVVMIQPAVQTILSAIAILPHIVITLALPVQTDSRRIIWLIVANDIQGRDTVSICFPSHERKKQVWYGNAGWLLLLVFYIVQYFNTHKNTVTKCIYWEKLSVFVIFPPIDVVWDLYFEHYWHFFIWNLWI